MKLIPRKFLFLITFLFCSAKAHSQCPKSYAWICGRLSGYFVKVVFQNQDEINADRICSGLRRETQIDSFQVLIIRDSCIIFNSKNIGKIFDRNLKNFIKKVELGDKVLFFNIWGTDYDGTKVYLNPLEYILIE